jgi:glycosyltransferase involved in cell wall biosynthesis
MQLLCKKEYTVYLLTTCGEGYIHKYVRQFGVTADASPIKGQSGIYNYLKQAFYLYKYCKANKIRTVLAQQQSAALPALLCSVFLRLRIAYFRHNSDEDYQSNPAKAWRLNKLLNKYLKILIAPSAKVMRHWISHEKVNPDKITRINYGYNFDQYEHPDLNESQRIKKEYSCDLLIVSIARLVSAKRHLLMFQAVQSALLLGVDCKFLCIGTGPDAEELKKWIVANDLESRIFLLGYRSNIFDYLNAAGVYLHLSSTEASNSSVKEAGLAACPVIVCKGVGDFDDYIENNVNSFLVNQNPSVTEVADLLASVSKKGIEINEMGKKLKETILTKFNISNVERDYESLLNKMNT